MRNQLKARKNLLSLALRPKMNDANLALEDLNTISKNQLLSVKQSVLASRPDPGSFCCEIRLQTALLEETKALDEVQDVPHIWEVQVCLLDKNCEQLIGNVCRVRSEVKGEKWSF